MKIRTAIVGPGKIAHIHAKGILKSEYAEFVGVCGRSIDRAAKFADKYGVRAYDDLERMILKGKVQALIVCTPHPYHRDPVVLAAKLGVHCLVEKPLASTLHDCDKMINAAEKNNVKLGVVSQRRFYGPVLRMKKAIDEGKIGTPVLGHVIMLGWRDETYYKSDPWRGKWETEGGGVLVNQAPHQLDLFQWLMGPIEQVYGLTRNLNHPFIEVEDTALAIVQFKNGAVGNILLSNSQKPGIYGKVHIHGSNGASVGSQIEGGAMFLPGRQAVLKPPVNDLWTIPGEEEFLDVWKKEDTEFFETIDTSHHYLGLQIDDFCRSVAEDREPVVTGVDGRKTVELFTAIYRSSRDKAPVNFPVVPEDTGDFDGRLSNPDHFYFQ